ncbi:Dihydrofolate reductase [Caenispirillum salinarum AK4]|uniref:Dihydrofolate reductase n=1 Tax=Caenispirillum salinarum AK4 TaxID=1238182 RepID=K9GP45_9PROT|nr:dihydrofolate reductase [Caenispirillum salinarum]EKV27705.1 Dihydrofolate reductase [Caenispirillum salinarum AK4]
MRIGIIVARAENGVIGHEGGMPWDIPEDLRHFKRVTSGGAVIMGRRTYESIGRPLPKRLNVVVSRSMAPGERDGLVVVDAFGAALEACRDRGYGDVFAIGGEAIFREALPRADRLYLTNIFARPEGDTFFPAFDESAWTVVDRDPRDGFEFLTLIPKDVSR